MRPTVKLPTVLSIAAFLLILAIAGPTSASPPATVVDDNPLRIVVMDPLAAQLACDCVGGYAQRDYLRLGRYLQAKLGRSVDVAFAETLTSPMLRETRAIDLVIGKFSEVIADAQRVDLPLRSLAMLTDRDGLVSHTGLFVVRSGDSATSIEDLAGRELLFGPDDADEKRSAAFATLEAFDVPLPQTINFRESCSSAALAVVEQDADAAVISGYAMPLVEGCGTIDKGTLRVIGRTDPVPFIGLFASANIDREAETTIVDALLHVDSDDELLISLESAEGFVALPDLAGSVEESGPSWTDWRGRDRRAHSDDVPTRLPERPMQLWSRTMTGPGMAGLAVQSSCLVVADKNLDETDDIFRCLDADTGRQRWKITYPAAGEMDFTNSPRANPVICSNLVYLLGAFGDLVCARLTSGQIVWKRHLAEDFAAERPAWGYSATPLIVDDRLIVNPGARDASVVALDRHTGKILWKSPGDAAGYASFITARYGGGRQIVGYDAVSLGGWAPDTGRRLWRLVPEYEGDFNVPTPINVDGRLLVTTENNGTRLYGFDAQGRIRPKPLAANEGLAGDTSTAATIDGLVFGNHSGLMCLDLNNGLEPLWEDDRDDDLTQYCSFIVGNGHVLITSQTGRLYLVRADRQRCEFVGRLPLFDDVPDTDREVWSHPALVGNRLYIRNLLAVYCFLL